MTLAATASDSDGTIAKVDFYAGSTLVGSAGAAPSSTSWNPTTAATYTLTAVATDNAGATTTSAPVTVTVTVPPPPPSTLPDGWTHQDIGATGAAGSAVASGGVFTVTGAGADVWGTSDALQYAYTTLAGDGTIVARVATVQNIANWTKAGVMIRNGVSPSAAQALMLVSPGKGVAFQRRLSDGASSVSTSGTFTTAPRWVKLTRAGNTIAAFESADGATWSQVGSDTFQMGASVDVGLAVSSHVAGVLATATFDSVSVSTGSAPSNAPPTVSLTTPVSGATFVAPATIALTATAADADGSIARVEFYSGTTLLGTATASPYTFTWAAVPAGSYSVTAVATDNLGASTTSAPVAVTVTAPVPDPAGRVGADRHRRGAVRRRGGVCRRHVHHQGIRARHLGDVRPVPLCVSAARRRCDGHRPRRVRAERRDLGEGGDHDPRDARGEFRTRINLRLGCEGRRLSASRRDRDRQRQHCGHAQSGSAVDQVDASRQSLFRVRIGGWS